MKRLLVLFLALIMLLGCLAACGKQDGQKTSDNQPKEQDKEADQYLSKKDYTGKTYAVLYRDSSMYEEEWVSNENKRGDVINEAIASRNQAVIDRYGITLDYTSGRIGTDFDADFWPKVTTTTEDDTYQLVAGQTYRLATASVTGYFLNWLNPEQIPNVDTTAEWWDKEFIQAAKYNGCTYIATGPLSLTDMYSSACIYFNKDLLNKYMGSNEATNDLFKLVEDGEWTLDKLQEYAAKCTDKLEGAENDEGAVYGLSTNWNNQIDAYIYASNLTMTERKNGTIVLKTVDASNPILSLAKKLQSFHQDSGNVVMFGSGVTPERVYEFVKEKSVFCTGILQSAKDIQTYAKDISYGVLPYPKYDSDQKEYHTYKLDFRTGFCIPRSVKEDNRDFVGAITEALAYYSNKYVKPALYDKVLTHKNVQDEQSANCVTLILNGGLYEFSNIYARAWGDEQSPAHLLRKVVEPGGKGSDYYQEYSARLKSYNSKLKSLLESFKSDDVGAD